MREQIYKTLMMKSQYEMEDALLKIDYLMNGTQPVIVEHNWSLVSETPSNTS